MKIVVTAEKCMKFLACKCCLSNKNKYLIDFHNSHTIKSISCRYLKSKLKKCNFIIDFLEVIFFFIDLPSQV